MHSGRWGAGLAVVGALIVSIIGALAFTATDPARAASGSGPVRVEVISGRPDTVTGGDALVEVRGAGGASVQFTVDGSVVNPEPVRDAQWLVSGLTPGRHRIVARAGSARDAVVVRNHPITGPVFSGPHLPLLACSTEKNGLAAPTDADCSAPTKVAWHWKNGATGAFVSTSDPAMLLASTDASIATVTINGEEVPYIVRTETGVINRSVYWISIVDPDPQAESFDAGGWNGRLVYRYGGGCGQTFGQGTTLGTSTLSDPLLSAGYAVATATFNTFQVQCNDVLSAETTMMVKERFTETYGRPAFTIGDGGSGGAIQQLLIAQDYPGLLDAIAPTIPFPDAISISPGVSDCGLLAAYFRSTAGTTLTADQRAAISGYDTWESCSLWISSFLGGVNPTDGCDPAIPKDRIYDAVKNRAGIRCTLPDANRNQVGVDPETGFARRPLDNIGVEYGLAALNAGTITPDAFLDLNEGVGGYDLDGTIVGEREAAHAADLRRTYALGRVLQRTRHLLRTPIITTNIYTDARGDIHTRFRLFSIRERLRSPAGAVDRNHAIWTRPSGGSLAAGLTGAVGDSANLTATLDEWLTTGTRPAAAIDTCTGPDDSPDDDSRDDDAADRVGRCNELYPVFGDPRTAAGAPMVNDILKCRRKEPVAADYDVPFTDAQWTRLRTVFPRGVCDWSRPGVGQVPMIGTWIDY
ncbi:MAG: DUF6351 family protein, partial [Acidimicrobiia bacterium]